MAADLVSRPNTPLSEGDPRPCAFCEAPLASAHAHACERCGSAQPVRPTEDYFGALAAPRRFQQDAAALEKRFYELSRALHPDRFTSASPRVQAASLERMSFLNDAYRTLKDPGERRDYLLKLEGYGPALAPGAPKPAPPTELAESWFELQDAITEEPATAIAKLEDFTQYLGQIRKQVSHVLVANEAELDEYWEKARAAAVAFDRPHELLARLQEQVRLLSYVGSMERDVLRLRQRFNPGPLRRGEDGPAH